MCDCLEDPVVPESHRCSKCAQDQIKLKIEMFWEVVLCKVVNTNISKDYGTYSSGSSSLRKAAFVWKCQ